MQLPKYGTSMLTAYNNANSSIQLSERVGGARMGGQSRVLFSSTLHASRLPLLYSNYVYTYLYCFKGLLPDYKVPVILEHVNFTRSTPGNQFHGSVFP